MADKVIIDHNTLVVHIDLLCFSVRTRACLNRLRVVTILDLVSLKETQFASRPPCTRRHVLVEIDQQLEKINLKRGMTSDQVDRNIRVNF